MGKKKYSTDQLFYCTFAVNTRKESYEDFKLRDIKSATLGLHDTIVKTPEMSDGEVAQHLSRRLNEIYGYRRDRDFMFSLINWWPI